jgi:hypothetical protein
MQRSARSQFAYENGDLGARPLIVSLAKSEETANNEAAQQDQSGRLYNPFTRTIS